VRHDTVDVGKLLLALAALLAVESSRALLAARRAPA
jgi:hypothetical protein